MFTYVIRGKCFPKNAIQFIVLNFLCILWKNFPACYLKIFFSLLEKCFLIILKRYSISVSTRYFFSKVLIFFFKFWFLFLILKNFLWIWKKIAYFEKVFFVANFGFHKNRSSHQRCSIEKVLTVLKNFAKYIGKNLCKSIFF